jgi:hypothetical protein
LRAALDEAPGSSRAADALRLMIPRNDFWIYRGRIDDARRHYRDLAGAEGVSAPMP